MRARSPGARERYMPAAPGREPGGDEFRRAHPSEAVSSTESSVTLVHSSLSGPADTLWPWVHDTPASPTPRRAWPSWTPESETVVPRMSAFAPSPLSVAAHLVPEHETLFDVKLQAASGTSASAP